MVVLSSIEGEHKYLIYVKFVDGQYRIRIARDNQYEDHVVSVVEVPMFVIRFGAIFDLDPRFDQPQEQMVH